MNNWCLTWDNLDYALHFTTKCTWPTLQHLTLWNEWYITMWSNILCLRKTSIVIIMYNWELCAVRDSRVLQLDVIGCVMRIYPTRWRFTGQLSRFLINDSANKYRNERDALKLNVTDLENAVARNAKASRT